MALIYAGSEPNGYALMSVRLTVRLFFALLKSALRFTIMR